VRGDPYRCRTITNATTEYPLDPPPRLRVSLDSPVCVLFGSYNPAGIAFLMMQFSFRPPSITLKGVAISRAGMASLGFNPLLGHMDTFVLGRLWGGVPDYSTVYYHHTFTRPPLFPTTSSRSSARRHRRRFRTWVALAVAALVLVIEELCLPDSTGGIWFWAFFSAYRCWQSQGIVPA